MKTALITGATSGIGEQFARRYAKMGYRLILVGRRQGRLCRLKDELAVPCRIMVYDLSLEDSCKELLEQVKEINIDVFINNAGFGTCGSFLETDLDKEISMIRVNDIAMHILFKGILKQMQQRDVGTILNVASSAGLMPGGPYMATYYATKAYMVSLTRAVAEELRQADSSVNVFALCPGPVDTEFNENADVAFALPGISARKCVKDAMRGMKRGKTIIVPSLYMKVVMFAQNFLPKGLMVRIAATQQKKKIYR